MLSVASRMYIHVVTYSRPETFVQLSVEFIHFIRLYLLFLLVSFYCFYIALWLKKIGDEMDS